MERDLMTEELSIKLYTSFCKEDPMIEIKGFCLLNTDRLKKIVEFFEEQTGHDLSAKIELQAELW